MPGWWVSLGISGFWLFLGFLAWFIRRDRRLRKEAKDRGSLPSTGAEPGGGDALDAQRPEDASASASRRVSVRDLERMFGKKG